MDAMTTQLGSELAIRPEQVQAAIHLLDTGATVPFIARYRKEATQGLDDTQLRQLEDRLRSLRALMERRETILRSIEEQGLLTPQLAQQLSNASTRTELEDLYLPYKPKRRTRGQIALEQGLGLLAEALLKAPDAAEPESLAQEYINPAQDLADAKAVLDGARAILMERFAEQAEWLSDWRQQLQQTGFVVTQLVPEQAEQGQKFADYFDHHEAWSRMPSHRVLAVLRGRNEGVLRLSVRFDPDPKHDILGPQLMIARAQLAVGEGAMGRWRAQLAQWTWRIKIHPYIELDCLNALRERAEAEAIAVFGRNLKHLLLAAPAGLKVTLGMDPAYRTGVKLVVIDATGRLLEHAVIFPHQPQNQWAQAEHFLTQLCRRHGVSLVAVGNGTASRETETLARSVAKANPDLGLQVALVSEAGASVYSASELAAQEFPALDVSYRGAVSIARRLQDPLAELVKIDPKAIGVGQYQHDVSQVALQRTLESVIEDCVNAVGVDLNRASVPLLSRVSGLNARLAQTIVHWRETQGRFDRREQLLSLPQLGPKTYEQCAGFLRIQGGSEPLDASAVHPEAYPLVRTIVAQSGRPLEQLLGDERAVQQLSAQDFVSPQWGLPTVQDVLAELAKPGRDPRPEFQSVQFRDDIHEMKDLQLGMVLEGVVSNVTNFGAFVDIGVHQDGLVHISAMSHSFVRDPSTLLEPGQLVRVKVMSVDQQRRRIGLSLRLDDIPEEPVVRSERGARPQQPAQLAQTSALGSALQQALAGANTRKA